MLSFLSPLFLIGALTAAIPLVIHLSRSRRQKQLLFSTTRFFTDQFLRSYRMSRLKEIGLLLARMALFALFALALAQPILLPKGRPFLTGKRTVVLVLDNSASMGYVENGVRLFDRARATARELLDSLRPGDAAAVVLAARRATGPEVLFPEPTTALGDVRQALDRLDVAALGTDLSGALARAETVARTGSANSREVYLLSDLQDAGWELRDQDRGRPAASDVLFFFVRLRPQQPDNLAITAIQYAAARPMVGIPFSIRPHVLNQGRELRATELALVVDGQKVAQQHLDRLQPGHWAVPLLHHTFTSGGWHTGYVEIQDPNFPADNRRYFAFEVMDSIRVLAVNGAPSEVPRLDELFFVKTALGAAAAGKSPIQMDEVLPAEMPRHDLGGYRLVILANVESLPPAAIERLEEYVDRGGSLLVFLGDKVSAAAYNADLAGPARLHGGLLPARLTRITGSATNQQDCASVGSVDAENPALAAFADPRFASLTSIGFKALWELEPRDGAVLMRANTGAPLLCEKSFGKGRVMLFASTCSRAWTEFPLRPAFLPWLDRVVADLAQEPFGRKSFFATGDRVPLAVAATAGLPQILIRKPDGGVVPATTSNDPRAPLEFTDTTELGVYTISAPAQAGRAAAPPRELFVANLEGYESDLTYLDDVLANRPGAARFASRQAKIEAGLKELWPGRPLLTYVDDPGRVTELSVAARRGFKLWDFVLLVVLLLALLEPWLANRISLRHYTEPNPKSSSSSSSSSPSVVAAGGDDRGRGREREEVTV